MSIQDLVKRSVLYLGFEERTGTRAFDSSPKANNGTLGAGAAAPTWVASKDGFGGALDFDGDDYVALSSFALLGTVLTFSARVKCSIEASYQTIIGDGSQHATVGFIWLFRIISSDTLALQFADGASWAYANSAGYFTGYDDTDVDVVVVCDYAGKTCDFYRNGIFVNRVAMSGTPVFPTTDRVRHIGAYSGVPAHGMIGTIDDVYLLQYGLTPTEIRGHSESRSAFTATPNLRRGLVLDLDLQEGAGTKAFDRSWYAHNGDLEPGSGSINNQAFTSDWDTPVQLNRTNITPGTTNVTDNGVTYTEGIDYTMDNPNGTITVLSTGGMADATGYLIDYDYADSYPAWVPGGGLDFDGVDDYVNCGTDASLDITNAITIIYSFMRFGGNFLIHTEDKLSKRSNYLIAGTARSQMFAEVGGGALTLKSNVPIPSNDVRYTFAHSYDSETRTAHGYRDGQLIDTNVLTGLPYYTMDTSPAVPLTISHIIYPVNGVIYKMRIYTRALSHAEIRAVTEEWA